MTEEISVYHHNHSFDLRRGGQLKQFQLAWESWGSLNQDKSNVVLIFTGLSPDAHAASNQSNPTPGWWEFMLGPDKPIDTKKWFVLCVNSLGSCKGSTGPASINPETQQRYATDFPELSLEDIASSVKLLLEHLSINRLAVVVGPSMGGMSAQAFCAMHPSMTQNLISISSAPHASPFAIAIRSLQREAIRNDPAYLAGLYPNDHLPATGMKMARKLGMLSYRSAEEWRTRFARQQIPEERKLDAEFSPEFEIESYLAEHADRFVGSFDPNCYLYLSRAMDWFDIANHAHDVDSALAKMNLDKALVIGVKTDILFPVWQQEQIADGLRKSGTNITFFNLASIQGHDAFLVDKDRFSQPVSDFLSDL